MDDSNVQIGEVTIVVEGDAQDLGLSTCRVKQRGFKVATKVNQRKSSKFVSCSCRLKGCKQACTSPASGDQENNPSVPSTPSSDQVHNPSIPCHAIFIFLDPLLLGALQVEYQNKHESPFDTHPVQMQTFLVAICIYSSILGFKIHNKHSKCDQILRFVLLISGSVSSGGLLSILLHRILSWLGFIILGSIPIIMGRHLIKNSVNWILGLVEVRLDLIKSKFSTTMVSTFHRKAQVSNINLTGRVEGI